MLYFVLVVLLLSPFVLSGQFSIFAGFVLSISVLLLFVANRFNRRLQRTVPNISLTVLFLISLILLPFSLLATKTLVSMTWLLGYLGIFLYLQNLSQKEVLLKNMAKIFVAFTALFGILSLSKFIDIGLTAYTRLDGIIGTHNVYGGFLIIPFLLSIYLIMEEKGKWQNRLWYASGAIILTSLVLTFSRGTWVSILFAVILSLLIFRKKIFGEGRLSKEKLFSLLKPVGILATFSFVIFCGVWYMARQTALNRDPSVPIEIGLYPLESLDQNAFVARLNYFQDAWNTFIHSPLIGFGSGMYANSLRMYKTDPSYGSFADPHNWFLKMLVENGVIFTLLFSLFVFFLFLDMARLILRIGKSRKLTMVIFAGLLGSAIHGLMDFDWSNNLLLLVFFVFAGSLYGYLLNNREGNGEIRYLPKWVNYVLLVFVILGAIVSIQFLRADLVRARGDLQFFSLNDNDGAINSYFESATLNSRDPSTWYSLWRVYFATGKYVPARNSITKALEIFPENGIYWGALARTEEVLGDKEKYRESLLKAIEYFPASDLSYYVKLVKHDFEQKKYDEAMSFIDRVLPVYSAYESSSWYKTDPNWPLMSENLVVLREYKKKIENVSGNL